MNFDGQKAAEQFATSDAFNNGAEMQTVRPGGRQDMSSVLNITVPQTVNEKLMALRANNPFLEITPISNYVNNLVITVAGTPEICPVPAGAQYMIVETNATYIGMSLNGNASRPDVTGITANITNGGGTIILARPINKVFYVGDVQSICFNAPANNTLISVSFYFH